MSLLDSPTQHKRYWLAMIPKLSGISSSPRQCRVLSRIAETFPQHIKDTRRNGKRPGQVRVPRGSWEQQYVSEYSDLFLAPHHSLLANVTITIHCSPVRKRCVLLRNRSHFRFSFRVSGMRHAVLLRFQTHSIHYFTFFLHIQMLSLVFFLVEAARLFSLTSIFQIGLRFPTFLRCCVRSLRRLCTIFRYSACRASFPCPPSPTPCPRSEKEMPSQRCPPWASIILSTNLQ